MRKWHALADESDVNSFIPLFHGYGGFNTKTLQRLQVELTTKKPSSSSSSAGVCWLSPCSSSSVGSPTEIHSGRSSKFKKDGELEEYSVMSFLQIEDTEKFAPLQTGYHLPTFPNPSPLYHQGEFEFLSASEKYYSSSFTSNSQVSLGEIRVRAAGPDSVWSEWKPIFVKKGPHINDEFDAFPTVQKHFPLSCLQRLVAVDYNAQMLFYDLFEGMTLSEMRLDYYLGGKSFLTGTHKNGNEKGFLGAVNWFLDLELRRAEHILDAYSKTIDVNPDPTSCSRQRIHRFYYARLKSDSRFLEFYSERCLDVLKIPSPKQDFTTGDFMNAPLIINGVTYPPLRHHFDRATDLLDPYKEGGLSSLPVAFGLGDGHGGNLMVTEDINGSSARAMYIDYEVSGSHSPFLDMAKSIYIDAFFNVLYADLLCGTAIKSSSSKNNMSGATVSWDIQPDTIDIDYKLRVDKISKCIATSKLEYVLLPIFDLVNRHDTLKANLSLDVLSSALFTCAMLTRNFRERPDVFFLNLAIGVRLATEPNELLSEIFGWDGFPLVRSPGVPHEFAEGMQLQLLSPGGETHYSTPQWLTDPDMDLSGFLFPSNLQPDNIFLMRANDTYQLQQRFSRTGQESQGTIIRRISEARRAGMMV
jgi:hypothetical protein